MSEAWAPCAFAVGLAKTGGRSTERPGLSRAGEFPEIIELSSKSRLSAGFTPILSAGWLTYISLPREGRDCTPKNKRS
jgi:hypothetical protein